MNLELEIKVRLKDPSVVRAQLEELGAEHKKPRRVVDVYFDTSSEQFDKHERFIRIRTDGESPHGRLEYHIPTSDIAGEEYEVEIQDAAAMSDVLQNMGYRKIVTVDKTRESWTHSDFHIDIDHIKDVGDFMEVELMNVEEDTARKRITAFLKRLDITKNDYCGDERYYMMVPKEGT